MVASFAPTRNAAKHAILTTLPEWFRWPRMSRHAHAIRFIETYCRPAKGVGHGSPLRLATFQKEFLEQALATKVDAAVLTTPRGNGKSTFGGALAVWAAFADDETGAPQVPVVATTIRQAELSCYGAAAAMVKSEPELANRSVTYTGIGMKKVAVHYNGGELFPISNDPDGLQGLDFSLALVDEIGFQPMDSWDSLRMAAGKRAQSLIVGMGTPGLDRDNALFHLRKLIADGAETPGFLLTEHTVALDAPIGDPRTWRKANPALRARPPFLRESALRTDYAIAPEATFRLFRLNQHVDNISGWLGMEGPQLWEALRSPYPLVANEPTWIGVDVGLKRDSTAVVCLQRRPDGRYQAQTKVWVPEADRPVDITDVMGHLRQLAATYDVQAISYDPRFFDLPAKMLEDDGLPVVEIPQSVERMTTICGSLLEAIKAGAIAHDGDPILTAHVLGAQARINERGFTLQKSKSRGRIDAVIALALALDRAQRGDETSYSSPEFFTV